MGRIERHVEGNEIGISIKYPHGINRKWSEDFVKLVCENCGSENIDCNREIDDLKINCKDCSNSWKGDIGKILTFYHSEEARVDLHNKPFKSKK